MALVGVVVAFYYLKILPKKRLGAKKVEGAPSVKVVGLPDDLREVMDTIKKGRGNIVVLKE